MGIFDFLTVRKPPPGTPVKTVAEMRKAVLAVNRHSAPWHVREATAKEKCDLVAEWRIVDAKWYEIFAKAGLQRAFKILLKFDTEKNEVRALDQEWEIEWRAGVPSLAIAASAFRGQKWEMSFGEAYAFTEKGTYGEVYNYRFATREMKNPLRKAVADAGWTWRGITFGRL